jgi:DNA-binding Lrp family transcriptional regulator
MYGISAIDAKILRDLLEDGRKSFSAIGNECHVSKDVIWKHYREMKKACVIVGSTIQFNYLKFGYSGTAMIMLSVESQHANAVFERLKKIPDIFSFRYYNATHNLAAISHLKSMRDLERAKETLNKESPIIEIKTYLWMDIRNIPENILADTFQSKPEKPKEKKPQADIATQKSSVKLDETDMRIVEKLTENGRTSFTRIAQEIGSSTDTITRRYEKLTKNNFIKVSIQINFLQLGYQAILYTYIALSNQSETKEAVEKLSKIPGVSYLVKISGDYDLQLVALVKDCNDIMRINDEIAKISNIKRIEASMRPIPPAWPGPRQYISTF